MRHTLFGWLLPLALTLVPNPAHAQDQEYGYDYTYESEAGDNNWFEDDEYEDGVGGDWDYDWDLFGDDEWEYDDDNLLTDEDPEDWGTDQYGDYDNDYDWETDDDTFDSWYGDAQQAFGTED